MVGLKEVLKIAEITIYYDDFQLKNWTLFALATGKGLVFVGSKEEVDKWLSSRPDAKLVEDPEKLAEYINQLKEYSHGKRQQFDMLFDVEGTEFQETVWAALEQIPYGQTTTYSDIARQIGRENAVRAVGSAVGANPLLIIVPCHRVLQKNGNVSNYREGSEMKQALLALEKSASD